MQVSAIGLSWYEREDYPRIREIMDDPHNFAVSYDDFVQAFENAQRSAERSGAIVVRAVIEPEEFLAWCRRHDLKVDAQARTRFGAEVAAAEVRRRQDRR